MDILPSENTLLEMIISVILKIMLTGVNVVWWKKKIKLSTKQSVCSETHFLPIHLGAMQLSKRIYFEFSMHLTRNKNTTQNDFLSYIFIYLEQKKKKSNHQLLIMEKKKNTTKTTSPNT